MREIVGRARRLPVQGHGKRERLAYNGLVWGRPLLLQFNSFLFARGEVILIDHSGTSIPTQQSIVISGRPNRLCFFEPIHRLTKSFVGLVTTPGCTPRQLSFGSALRQNPTIIGMFILAPDSR